MKLASTLQTIKLSIGTMSTEKLPTMPIYKHTLGNYEVAMHMGNHRRKMQELRTRRNREHNTISYKELLEENPKKHYMLETKYTEIERENRLLFQKIAKNNSRKKSPLGRGWSSLHQMGSLNATYRKQQIQQIERENVKMFGRIQKQKASISFRKADKEYNKTRRLSNQLSTIEKHRLCDWY